MSLGVSMCAVPLQSLKKQNKNKKTKIAPKLKLSGLLLVTKQQQQNNSSAMIGLYRFFKIFWPFLAMYQLMNSSSTGLKWQSRTKNKKLSPSAPKAFLHVIILIFCCSPRGC